MPDALRFSTLRPSDLFAIERQPSQQVELGEVQEITLDVAELYATQPVAWTVRRGMRIMCCFGIVESFAGRQGCGWALLAPGIGFAHLELTRFVRGQVEACGLRRLEVLARASGASLAEALARPTPEVRWGQLLGLTPAHLLREYGAAGETYMLFERIAGDARPMREVA